MILALDFDGVLCDSISECLDTSYRAFCEVEGGVPAVVSPAWRDMFIARRGLVRPSGHYLLLWQWITKFADQDLSPKAFEDLAASQADTVQRFAATFHRIRDQRRDARPEEFVADNPLFPDVVRTWDALASYPTYVVTTKDEPSVRLILDSHSLSVNGVMGRGSGPKPMSLLEIARRHRVDVSSVVFVDDNPQHLADAAAVGSTVVMALWGYGPATPVIGAPLATFGDLPALLASGQLKRNKENN